MTASSPDFGLPPDAPDAERRRKLAEWIASDGQPALCPHDRQSLWQYHFGRGLVETPNDFGFNGGQPSHPELLDWLAGELIARKWSLKELHRLIVTSATYRQASRPRAECLAVDADNRLLWRFSPRRLEAEAVRDAMLVVAGQLNPAASAARASRTSGRTTTKQRSTTSRSIRSGREFNRRSIYRIWARGGKNPLLDTFDCPDPSTATPAPRHHDHAAAGPGAAEQLVHAADGRPLRRAAGAKIGQRAPSSKSRGRLSWRMAGRRRMPNPMRRWRLFAQHGLAAFCRVLFNTNGFLYVD